MGDAPFSDDRPPPESGVSADRLGNAKRWPRARDFPGAYFFLGTGNAQHTTPGCHHPDFDFDDGIIPLALRMFVGILNDRLSAD